MRPRCEPSSSVRTYNVHTYFLLPRLAGVAPSLDDRKYSRTRAKQISGMCHMAIWGYGGHRPSPLSAEQTANMTSTASPKARKRQRSSSAPLRSLVSAYLIANSSILAFSGTSSSASSPQHIVKICQNKDCRKRFSPRAPDGSLVDVVRDLFPSSSDNTNNIAVESSGCLSQCGRGPNVCVVEADSGKERLFFGVDSASTAAAILDVSCDYDPPVDLILAADKISKAQIGKSACMR